MSCKHQDNKIILSVKHNSILLWYKPSCVQPAVSRLCTRKQKDKTLQLQSTVTQHWDLNPV